MFRYALRDADGDDAGEFETAVPDWHVGDTFTTGDGRQLRIVSIVPVERIEEFVDQPIYGVWQVEPTELSRDELVSQIAREALASVEQRQPPGSAGPPSHRAFWPRGSTVGASWLLAGLEQAIARFRANAHPFAEPSSTFVPLFEALNWAVSLDDHLTRDRGDPLLLAVRYARNHVHHSWADVLQFEPGAELGVLILDVSRLDMASVWSWRDASALPSVRGRRRRDDETEYRAELEGRPVTPTLEALHRLFAEQVG